MYFITLERKNELIRIDTENEFTLMDFVKKFYRHRTLDDTEYMCIYHNDSLLVKVSGHFIRNTECSWVLKAIALYHSNRDQFCPSELVSLALGAA